jgi:hypothetical protein
VVISEPGNIQIHFTKTNINAILNFEPNMDMKIDIFVSG